MTSIPHPTPEGEGGVEEADVGEAGFAEEGLVVFGGEDGELFADGGAGGFGVGALDAGGDGEGGVAGEPEVTLFLAFRDAVVRDDEGRAGLQTAADFLECAEAFVGRDKVEREKAGGSIEGAIECGIDVAFVEGYAR